MIMYNVYNRFIKNKKSSLSVIKFLFISVLSLLLSMHLSMFFDESFTMGLIHHGYINLIRIDSLDVHPPLYYVLLKLFLNITTFWSKSFFMKIIFARLFSFIIFILSFLVLCKILEIMKLKFNVFYLFVIASIVSLFFRQMTNIRMYPLAVLFVLLEFLGLVKYIYTHSDKCLICITSFSICSFYTHDFSGIISGLLILSLFIYYFFNNKFKLSLGLFISGIVTLIVYLPWVIVVIKQMKEMPSNYWITFKHTIISTVLLLFMVIFSSGLLFLCRNLISKRNKLIFYTLNCVCFLFIFIELSVSFIYQPIFTIRYSYPIIFIYLLYLVIAFEYCNYFNKDYHSFSYVLKLLICLLGIITIFMRYKSQSKYHVQSINMIRIVNNKRWESKLHFHKMNGLLPQLSIYAQYYSLRLNNKESDVIIYNPGLLSGTNKKLLKTIF